MKKALKFIIFASWLTMVVTCIALLLTSCNTHSITTKCRHVVLAQKSACLEKYKEVEIVYLKRGNDYHAQVRVKINGKWKYLKNSWTTYYFWDKPEKDFKIIKFKR